MVQHVVVIAVKLCTKLCFTALFFGLLVFFHFHTLGLMEINVFIQIYDIFSINVFWTFFLFAFKDFSQRNFSIMYNTTFPPRKI